ncbi:hypothetical protein AXF42_Ash018861 [Apostasia shenzhenica]|uniref:Glycosyltransferase 61 catalytic domain-containing protein n=1 Tax=Apostasia shenzhenica TaxID=1088818 RepID=A0A2I0B4Z2_9ASPA|nr:hypothetical protein AXF42_Ash018861 [Apostasia shenzhenica]
MAAHHHQINNFPSSPIHERDPKNKLSHSRILTLLLLLCYAAASVLRLSSSSPSTNPSSFGTSLQTIPQPTPPPEEAACSALIDRGGWNREEGLLCCDRSHHRTDVCYMRGDIRTAAKAAASAGAPAIHLHGARPGSQAETIRPYTRKWEKEVMSTIDEISLRPSEGPAAAAAEACEVRYGVPAIVFSTGGYTGNVYHEFNDGLIPLFITAERFAGEVVLVVLEFHSWWFTKYRRVLEKMSRYEIVDFRKDRRVHCFSEVIVGLKIHGELAVDPKLIPNGKGIVDFQSLLYQAFGNNHSTPRRNAAASEQLPAISVESAAAANRRPKMVILVRNGSRRILNLRDVLLLCHRAGFDVELLNPKRSTELAEIHRTLAGADAMMAVHGAAVTHFLFMRPGSVLIQVVPLGLNWAAETYYGEPARRLGLQYMAYNVTAPESSLWKEYGRRDPVLVDPPAITRRGWAETKRVYLDKQNVAVDLRRFGKLLMEAHARVCRSQSRERDSAQGGD